MIPVSFLVVFYCLFLAVLFPYCSFFCYPYRVGSQDFVVMTTHFSSNRMPCQMRKKLTIINIASVLL